MYSFISIEIEFSCCCCINQKKKIKLDLISSSSFFKKKNKLHTISAVISSLKLQLKCTGVYNFFPFIFDGGVEERKFSIFFSFYPIYTTNQPRKHANAMKMFEI